MSRTSSATLADPAGAGSAWTRSMLVALLAVASLAFSLAFACATPFAGLAAVAALRMKRRDALAAVTLAWAINQANGFLVLHYPWAASTIGWGLAIWAAAIAAVYAATLPRAATAGTGGQAVAAAGALAGAFIAYEGVLLAATLVLPSAPGAFSAAVVGRIFAIDAAAFALLLAMIGAIGALGVGAPLGQTVSARAE